ncbi:C-GCAxxG-C-C family protein [Atopobiaceae bacterium 24-176]
MESRVRLSATAVSPHQVQRHAEELYRSGFFCCEAVMSAIRSDFGLDVPEEVIAMSSGMSVGAGRSGCMCGALNGGILALGMVFGRTTPDGPKDPKVNALMALTNELHDWFRDATAKRAVCCRVLTRGFDMGSGEHREQCIAFTGLAAGKVAEILCRELGVENLDDEPVSGLAQPYLPPSCA